jgi:hypothetical protein
MIHFPDSLTKPSASRFLPGPLTSREGLVMALTAKGDAAY